MNLNMDLRRAVLFTLLAVVVVGSSKDVNSSGRKTIQKGEEEMTFKGGHAKVASDTLQQIHVLVRHGARAPTIHYPGDPTENPKLWPNGFGELIKEGLVQHDHVGSWFRHRYGRILGDVPRPKKISAISTDYNRCLNSAQANFAGMYPIAKERRYRSDLPYIPVAIHTTPQESDMILLNIKACPAVQEEIEKFHNSPGAKKIMGNAKNLFEMLEKNLKTSIPNLYAADFVYDTFKIRMDLNYTVPDYIPGVMDHLREISYYVFDNWAQTPIFKTLRGGAGPLLKKITNDMESSLDVIESNSQDDSGIVPLFFYAAHDTTIASNLQALGLYNNIKPPYAAAIIYELHFDSTTGKNFVEILYHNDTTFQTGPFELKLEGCSQNCSLEKFKAVLGPILPYDLKKQCKLETFGIFKQFGVESDIMFHISFFILGVIVSAIIIISIIKLKQRRNNNPFV